jgi:hypothetical protein
MLKPIAKQYRICNFGHIWVKTYAILMAFVGRIYENAWNLTKNVVQLAIFFATCGNETHRHAMRVPPASAQNAFIVTIARAIILPQRERRPANGFNVVGIWNIWKPAHMPVKIHERHRQPCPQVGGILLGNPSHLGTGQKYAFKRLHSLYHGNKYIIKGSQPAAMVQSCFFNSTLHLGHFFIKGINICPAGTLN